MEADWSVEIGPDLPLIDGSWEGYVDLRASRGAIERIDEGRQYPALRDALLQFNSEDSPVFTTKSDAWTVPGEEIDPDELAATSLTAQVGFASYIDVLGCDAERFTSFEFHERWVREITNVLRGHNLRQCRADIVVRRAYFNKSSGVGLSLYVSGCGATDANAAAAWQAALAATVAATIATARHQVSGE